MTDDIGQWLDKLGLGKHADLFAENEIDFAALRHLNDDDLKELGLPMGPRKKILAAIADIGPSKPTPTEPAIAAREAERRQLTVTFVDLVGSTALSAKLDPEDLRDIIQRYQNVVAGEVARYEGHVAKFMGDGVLVYFGYPRAHEDEAERAVRAGLGIVAAVGREVVAGERLQVRIGVATGQVVVGDLVGEGAAQEEAVIGETPNLAARLQELAAPGWIVVAQSTHDLLGGHFEVEDLGAHALKGFAEPITGWRVLGERAVESRFEAGHVAKLSRFVGRGEELSLLEERWARAQDSEGQVVLLSGEAGIGKSRLTRALMERLPGEPDTRFRYQCSPHHVNSALHPFIGQLERAAGFGADDDAGAKRAKLENLLRKALDDFSLAMPLVAALMSVPTSQDLASLEIEPQRQKQLTFEVLQDQIAGLAARQPVLMLFEDAHWADPTSLELLEQLVDQVQQAPILCVITGRPDFRPAWLGHSHVTILTLNRLGRRQGAEIVADLTDGKALPQIVLDQILDKTDGVALFVEELTKSVLESGLLEDIGDRYLLKGALPPLAIPSTLQDSLMARLDRLESVKEVAQIGAAIDREFPHLLLAEVSSLDDSALNNALGQLIEAGLLFRRGGPPDPTYVFKHALLQDTAYGSLLRDKRRAIHQGIAAALEAKYPERAVTEPEVLAHHHTEARSIEKAVPYWQSAGKRSAERFAHLEALEQLWKAIELLRDHPESVWRQERELETLITLGPVLMNTKGSASHDVRNAYLRARDLCDQVGLTPLRFPVHWGLWLHYCVAGDYKTALDLAYEAIDLAESLSNQDFLLQAHHATWTTLLGLADYKAAVAHADQGMTLYDVRRHRRHAFTYGGHDPGVCAALQGAVSTWFLGYPDQASHRCDKALKQAHVVALPYSEAEALAYVAVVRLFRREPQQAVRLLDELVQFSSDNGLTIWRANGLVLRNWALSEMGKSSEVLTNFRDAIRQRQSSGSQVRLSLYLAALAHALARAGESAEAQKVIGQALAQAKKTGELTWESYIHWVRGQILSQVPAGGPRRAAACYQEAYEIARRQQAKSMEVRAATSLARMWLNEDRKDEARNLLTPIYNWFTEGFDTPDLKDAKAVLDELT